MSKIWLISDSHFAHRNSMRYCGRPFLTAKACDEAMIRNINAVVKPDDILYHLGDVAMHTAPMKRLLPQIKCKNIILIIGNHDFLYSYFIKTRGQKFHDKMMIEYKNAGFSEIHKSGLIVTLPVEGESNGIRARLSHFPTKNAYDNYHNDKHDANRPDDDGTLNICGHVHQNWLKRGNNINVGVDVFNFKPVSLEEVVKIWKSGKKDIDNPYPVRVFFWKLYHTAFWKLKMLFRKDDKK